MWRRAQPDKTERPAEPIGPLEITINKNTANNKLPSFFFFWLDGYGNNVAKPHQNQNSHRLLLGETKDTILITHTKKGTSYPLSSRGTPLF